MEKTVTASGNGNTNYQPEESGWTSYFEDFSKHIESSYCSSSLGGSSLVSDAASCAAWKFSHKNHVRNSPNLSKKLSMKKTRTKQISQQDDPLEDTASSPVNSPRVSDMNPNPREMMSRKIDDQLDVTISRGKGFKSEHYPKVETNDCDINFNGKNVDCTGLEKKGLCLVPMSMLVNYYG